MPTNDVLIVSPYRAQAEAEIPYAGASAMRWYTRMLATALVRAGSKVTVLSTRPSRSPKQRFMDGVVPIEGALDPRPWRFSLSLLLELRRTSSTVVHVQHELYAYGSLGDALLVPLVLSAARIFFRKRIVTTIHGVFALSAIDAGFASSNAVKVPLPLVRGIWWIITAAFGAASDAIHVHEQRHAAIMSEVYRCPQRKIVVIPIGVTLVAREASPAERPPRVLFFGTISKRKGIVEFIQALPEVLRSRPDLHVTIAGDVPARLRHTIDLNDACRAVGVDPARVDFTGFVADDSVPELMAGADVMILPYTVSIAASGPLVLALGHGVPVLLSSVFASDFPDAPLLFDPKPAAIARTLERFFASDDDRRKVQNYWHLVAAERSWVRVAIRIQHMYARLSAKPEDKPAD